MNGFESLGGEVLGRGFAFWRNGAWRDYGTSANPFLSAHLPSTKLKRDLGPDQMYCVHCCGNVIVCGGFQVLMLGREGGWTDPLPVKADFYTHL